LQAIAAYAAGIGPQKDMAVAGDGTVSSLIADAHAVGLKVHPWTFRAENFFLPSAYRKGINPAGHGRLDDEITRFLDAGVDGLFTDYPYLGVQARDRHSRRSAN
ncbi:hypothetical protein K4H03_22010, partial [Mycobacterium tuberculosis]|nr:hypothetical protein [Mycobacterium tuberculosis]